MLGTLDRCRPDVVVVELYPFGRRKFEFELVPLLDAAIAAPRRPLVVSSVRDILVRRDDGGRHDDRAGAVAARYLDAVLVHSDPAFARFEESFRPSVSLAVPVHHTGFVVPSRTTPLPTHPARRVVVSAGGGMVGEALLLAAVAAAPAVARRAGLTTTVVLGPFLPADARRRVRATAAPAAGIVDVVDRVDDLCAEIAALDGLGQPGRLQHDDGRAPGGPSGRRRALRRSAARTSRPGGPNAWPAWASGGRCHPPP